MTGAGGGPGSSSRSRSAREASYWDVAYDADLRRRELKYYAIQGKRRAHYLAALTEASGPGARALELGCAKGHDALTLAAAGVDVVGLDVSAVAVEEARAAASERGLAERARFEVADAQELPFGDGTFDLVFASGTIHHLDVRATYAEIARVQAPGGTCVLTEPLAGNPLIDLYRRLTPSARTEDERPLTHDDLLAARTFWREVRVAWFHLASIAAVPLRRTPVFDPLLGALEHLDGALFRSVPPSRRWAWYATLVLRGPRPAGAERRELGQPSRGLDQRAD